MTTAADGVAPDGALGLHEELSEGFGATSCVCGPKHLRLRSEHGELVKPRGRSVNRCAYCARLAAVENAEMLWLDAMEGDAPAVWMVLGTRTATTDMAAFYRGLSEVKRKLRAEPKRDADGRVARDGRKIARRWPTVEYASVLEFTTGYGARSGGLRRPHWNVLLKGVPAEDADAALAVAAAAWCEQVDAEPHAQCARTLHDAGGLIRYLALHFAKESQAPPKGFTGQRFNASRGYFTGCTRATARARARGSLARKRVVWRVTNAMGPVLTAAEIEEVVDDELALAGRTRWTLANETGGLVGAVIPRYPAHLRAWLATKDRTYRESVKAYRDYDELRREGYTPPQAAKVAAARQPRRLTEGQRRGRAAGDDRRVEGPMEDPARRAARRPQTTRTPETGGPLSQLALEEHELRAVGSIDRTAADVKRGHVVESNAPVPGFDVNEAGGAAYGQGREQAAPR